MGAVKANNNKDTYKATAVAFIVIPELFFLINKLLPFASIGLPWVMNKDNLLLCMPLSVFLFSSVTSPVGFVLLGLWLVMNIGPGPMSLLGSLSGYLLPLALLIIGYFILGFKTLKKQ